MIIIQQALINELPQTKLKFLEVHWKLNSLITKDYSFFLGRNCFASNDGSQNTFVYQPTLRMLELKNNTCTEYILSWNLKG